jgi:hypothetical protein
MGMETYYQIVIFALAIFYLLMLFRINRAHDREVARFRQIIADLKRELPCV